MFTPFHLLQQNAKDSNKYRRRWQTEDGRVLHDKVMELIRRGAGEDFLEADYQSGKLPILENEWDLKGFHIFQEDIDFSHNDNFEGIDFSYSEFWHSKFKNALFHCNMSFSKFYNCTFENCVFSFNHCYASLFEKVTFINCDFIEYDTFINCSFIETTFNNAFFPCNVFHDCSFDANTAIISFPEKSAINLERPLHLKNENKAEIFREISEAYSSGFVYGLARNYKYLHLKCLTRYNTNTFKDKIAGYAFELISGYGIRPSRVLMSMIIYFIITLCVFSVKIGLSDAMLLTSGALFTFGAKAELLNSMGIFYHALYIMSSFVGISLTAVFITSLMNVFNGQK